MTEQTESLFLAQSGSITHEPSAKLIKRAERLESFDPSKYGGYLVRFLADRETKAAKVALFIPALAEALIEMPLTLGPALAYEKLRERQFTKNLIREYPHVGRIWSTEHPPILVGGTVNEFTSAVLAYPNQIIYNSSVNDQLPPNQPEGSTQKISSSPSVPGHDQVVPIIGMG